ncbi:Interferon-induced very large GTPase 1 [Holothuria leucospilota]|uniref:Interferon-induced very large GTPase 1 n=1 Tax=Holothuria leucospilota TaxID=206669 RepID=A0A9Q1H1X6_HOLLE|nr:Interferon-induced very large GTPase 1 [Holothuria leucospilota]
MKDLTEIKLLDEQNPTQKQDLPFLFLNKLTSLDSRVMLPENLSCNVNVRDFLYALIQCSDDNLRQHIMEKLASCQLAVTVLLPFVEPNQEPMLLIWALRRVVKKWKEEKTSLAPETPIVDKPVFTVGFIRIGRIPLSKSLILNNILGRAQCNEYFRYFISEKEDQKDSLYATGSIEAQWFLPMHDREGEILTHVTLFLNLRGDSNSFPVQRDFLCKTANAVFVFIDYKAKEKYEPTVSFVTETAKRSCIVYLTKKRRKNETHNIGVMKVHKYREHLEYYVSRGENIDLSHIICSHVHKICKVTKPEDYKSIAKWSEINETRIRVDQHAENCQKALDLLRSVFKTHNPHTIQYVKDNFFTLHTKWLEWVKADQMRINNKEETVASQIGKKNNLKRQIRQGQLKEGFSKGISTLLECFQKMFLEQEQHFLHYFMSHFQSFIERLVSIEIPPLIQKLDSTAQMLDQEKTMLKDCSDANEKIRIEEKILEHKKIIEDATNTLNMKHISYEHFIREFGHMYEALCEDENSNKRFKTLLTQIAVNLLLEGYSIELLDGESTYVPIKWIKGVLEHLCKVLHNPKVFTLSIIGIQSSGKSTLLNCMFGVRFPVRAGRCTRGLFMQLLKVHDNFKEKCGFQYLIIVDTEGLQCPDRTVKNDYTFDNSIATLSMCIADLSLLNVAQETIDAAMIGILQIAVHALIRMKKVRLVSHCRIIQQRVSDIAAAGNNKSNLEQIKLALDRATVTAAEEENVSHSIKEFADVFPFINDNEDLQFFPCLWMGLMSPPNSCYSDKIKKLRTNILDPVDKKFKNSRNCTLEMFTKRLVDVWEAVKEEDFVFSFQNSFDAMSYRRFRLQHNKWVADMRTHMVDWELKTEVGICKNNLTNSLKTLKSEINEQCENIITKIKSYVEENHKEEEVKRRETEFINDTIAVGKEITENISNYFKDTVETQEALDSLPQFLEEAQSDLRNSARVTAIKLRETHPNITLESGHDKLLIVFERIWKEKRRELEVRYSNRKRSDLDIEVACENCLTELIDQSFLKTNKQTFYDTKDREQCHLEERNGRLKIKKLPKRLLSLDIILGNEDEKSRQETLINKAFSDSVNAIKSRQADKSFDANFVKNIFSSAFETLKTQGIKDVFLIETLVKLNSTVTEILKQQERQYNARYTLDELFTAEKDNLKEDFLAYFDDTVQTERAIERSYTDIVKAVQELVINHINIQILSQMRAEDCCIDKQIMIGTILKELSVESKGLDYFNFINNNSSFIEEWLDKMVVNLMSRKVDSEFWVAKIAAEKIVTLSDTLETVLVNTKLDMEKDMKTSKMKRQQVSLSHWKKVSSKHFSTTEFKDYFAKLFLFNFPLMDYILFPDNLRLKITTLLKRDVMSKIKLMECNEDTVATNIKSQVKKNIALEVLDHLKSCNEVCPFCRVNCHLQGKNHKHKALLHYPQGIAGRRWKKSGKLTAETCSMLVSANASYYSNDLKDYRPYQNYTADYPEWDLTPIRDDKPLDYWQWVFVEHNDYFANAYGHKPADLPDEWSQVSKETAIKSLDDYFKLS